MRLAALYHTINNATWVYRTILNRLEDADCVVNDCIDPGKLLLEHDSHYNIPRIVSINIDPFIIFPS